MQQTDPRQTIDDSLCLEFLGAAAAAFHLSETFSATENAGLRISLAALRDGEQSSQSLLCRLYDAENDSLLQVINCFGMFSFWRNFFRFGFGRSIVETETVLLQFGAKMIQTAPLLFNRPFSVYVAGGGERRILFASLIMDTAEACLYLSQRLKNARSSLSVLIPNDLAITDSKMNEVEQKFAQQLGFAKICDDQLPLLMETDVVFQGIAVLQSFSTLVGELVYQIKANRLQDESSALSVLLDGLKSRLAALQAFHLPKTDEIHTLELARIEFLLAWSGVNTQAQKLANACNDVLKSMTIVGQVNANVDFTRNLTRTLSHTMIVKGTAPKKAEQAARDLLNYCTQKQLSPEQIIPAELVKINGHLSVDALQTLIAFEKDKIVGRYASASKEQNVVRHQSLSNAYTQLLLLMFILISSISIFGTSCGVKIGPNSDVEDLRPAIEYHGDAKPVPSATATPNLRMKSEKKQDAPKN